MHLHSARTGCSADRPSVTVAVASATGVAQLPAALALAERVLGPAKAEHHNETRIVLFGTGLADARPRSVENVGLLHGLLDDPSKPIDVVVSVNDLGFLRLLPSRLHGELCAVPTKIELKDVAETIACLRRPPPVDYTDDADLPAAWREHVRDLEWFEYLEKLWAQTLRDGDAETAEPAHLLALCAYAKCASMARRTTGSALGALRAVVMRVPGAAESGLLDVFEANFRDFLQPLLVGDLAPWKLTLRGSNAATKARSVLVSVFEHAGHVAAVLKRASLAVVVGDPDGQLVLVQSGLELDKLPRKASAKDGRLVVEFANTQPAEWTTALDADLHALVDFLDSPNEDVTRLMGVLGAYAALGVQDRQEALGELGRVAAATVTTSQRSVAAHVTRNLVLFEDHMRTGGVVATIAAQSGLSVACTFATFCGGTAQALRAPPLDTQQAEYPIDAAHDVVEQIAAALETPAMPLGSLSGTLGGVVSLDGRDHRVCYWKRYDNADDAFLTLLPKRYVEIAFADYATGSRSLDPLEREQPVAPPFVCADTLLTLFLASAIRDAQGLAFRLPSLSRTPILGDDEAAVYQNYKTALAGGMAPGEAATGPSASIALFVRESADDLLTGVRVKWARRILPGGAIFTHLIAANFSNETLYY